MENPYKRPTFGAAIFYKDPFAALNWLEQAFGFERSMVITDHEGKVAHSEMRFGGGNDYIMVGSEWADFTASPASVGGKNAQTIHVHLNEGLDAHCARARAAGWPRRDGRPQRQVRNLARSRCRARAGWLTENPTPRRSDDVAVHPARARNDFNIALPLEIFAEPEKEGKISSPAENHYSFVA